MPNRRQEAVPAARERYKTVLVLTSVPRARVERDVVGNWCEGLTGPPCTARQWPANWRSVPERSSSRTIEALRYPSLPIHIQCGDCRGECAIAA